MGDPEFRYVSCKAGRLTPRFGTGTYIGATFVPGKPPKFNEAEVVAIPASEWARYPREYGRVMRNGDVVMRTQNDHEAWQRTEAIASAKDAKQDAKDAKQDAKQQDAPKAPSKNPEEN